MSQYLSRHRRNLLACAIASLGLPAAAQITQLDAVVVTGLGHTAWVGLEPADGSPPSRPPTCSP